MINNETMQSILARRSYKMFDSRPIDDEALETIVTAGLYPTSEQEDSNLSNPQIAGGEMNC